VRDGVAHRLGTMSGECRSILHTNLVAMFRHARQVQRRVKRVVRSTKVPIAELPRPHDEVPFPVAWHGAIGCLRWTLADHDLGRDEGLASTTRAHPRRP
jgi:hypothetical protein